jgi:hypothetical protein
MKDYILYSLPLDFAECDSDAIDKKNYFKVGVRYVDGNTFQILTILNNTSDCVFCSPGTQLELHQMKFIKRYRIGLKWHNAVAQFRKCRIVALCPFRESNSGPSVYKTDALPLSQTGLYDNE